MKDKNFKELFKGKNLQIVLSVCFAVVIVSAGYITISNIGKINEQKDYAQLENEQKIQPTEEAEQVLINEQKPNSIISGQENLELSTEIELESMYSGELETDENLENIEVTIATNELLQTEISAENVEINEEQTQEVVQEIPVKEVFLNFNENENMLWPVEGNVVLDYSMEHTIYDPTLDQYRVNDSISIEAEKGTSVKAAALGTVVSVTNDEQNGYTVVLEHGNGWQSIYSQLQGDVAVSENEVVEAGEVIGGIGDPSRYSVMLGNHLDFSVTKDGVSIDPKTILE